MIAQDHSSSAVWGMPGSVAKAGLASAILPPGAIAATIMQQRQGGGMSIQGQANIGNGRAVDTLARLLEKHTGQQLTEARRWRVETSLRPLLRSHGIRSLDELVIALGRSPSGPLFDQTIDLMLNHESSFFRDLAVFQSIEQVILPGLRAESAKICLRIWCAGCGERQGSLFPRHAHQEHGRCLERMAHLHPRHRRLAHRHRGCAARPLQPDGNAAWPRDQRPAALVFAGRRALADPQRDPRDGELPDRQSAGASRGLGRIRPDPVPQRAVLLPGAQAPRRHGADHPPRPRGQLSRARRGETLVGQESCFAPCPRLGCIYKCSAAGPCATDCGPRPAGPERTLPPARVLG